MPSGNNASSGSLPNSHLPPTPKTPTNPRNGMLPHLNNFTGVDRCDEDHYKTPTRMGVRSFCVCWPARSDSTHPCSLEGWFSF